jgi:hypothetical protein
VIKPEIMISNANTTNAALLAASGAYPTVFGLG